MIYTVCTIYDMKAGANLQPFFTPNLEVAKRDFATLVNDASTKFYAFPSDYTLFEIGEFDEVAGEFTMTCRNSVANGVELKNVELVKESSSDK